MSILDTLIYDPERLACRNEERDACLETVKKLARLWKEVRRDGPLVVLTLAESEEDPFFRACLMESGDISEPEALEQSFCAYLAAGNYRGGAFLNAVLIVKGLLLLSRQLEQGGNIDSQVWAWRLSDELRGFFGPEYRKKVIAAIDREAQIKRKTSLIPEFDRLSQIPLVQRQALMRETDLWTLAFALQGASAAAEDALLEALMEDIRETLEEDYLPAARSPFEKDVTRAQEKLLKQWEVMKPSFT